MLLIQVALRKFNPEKVLTSLGTSASLLPQTLVTMPSPQTRSPCESHYIQNSLFPSNRHPGPPITRSRSQTLSRAAAQHGAIKSLRRWVLQLHSVSGTSGEKTPFPVSIWNPFQDSKIGGRFSPQLPHPQPCQGSEDPWLCSREC